MDIASLISSFATGTYTVTRTTRGTLSYGKYQDGSTSTLQITASVSPASGKDLLRVPEGRRTNESRLLFTTTELYTGDAIGELQSGYLADTIVIDSKTFEVSHVEIWRDPATQTAIGYRCIVQDVDS